MPFYLEEEVSPEELEEFWRDEEEEARLAASEFEFCGVCSGRARSDCENCGGFGGERMLSYYSRLDGVEERKLELEDLS
ncbi:MAG: hypothetical protein J5I35_07645 [Methanothrix harundinacea]|nr:hypothetical protein [Methanothrix harundinacea]